MFSFLQSTFLFALAAVSLPFIIHLLNKRKPKRVRFSTLYFLKQLQQKKMRRLKIRQLLLLILRALIIAMFVLAFARPTLKSRSFLLGSANVRTAAAIVLDNSMSMQWEGTQGQLYGSALEGAKNILQQLKYGDRISLFLTCPVSAYPEPQVFESNETLLKILSGTKATDQYGNLISTIKKAQAQLEKSIFPNKELYVVSDFQKTSCPDLMRDKQFKKMAGIRTFLLDVSSGEQNNLALKDVKLKNQIIELGKTVTASAVVENEGKQDAQDMMVHAFLLHNRVGQNTVSIAGGRSKEVAFNILIKQAGFLSGMIELEDDPLVADNRGYFSFYLPERIKILLFGDPADLRFFQLALAPNKNRRQIFSFETTEKLQNLTSPLSRFVAVVVADPAKFSDSDAAALIEYLKSGGHVLFFPGDKTDIRLVNDKLFKPLHLPPFRETKGHIGDFSSYVEWGSVNLNHPIFKDIFRKKVENIDSPKFYFRILLDSQAANGSDIIQFSDHSPFFSAIKINKGLLFLFTSAMDPDWSDFVYKPIFPPLLFRTVIFAASQTQQNTGGAVLGDELSAGVVEPYANYTMHRPDGTVEKLPTIKTGAALFVKYNQTQVPGIYTLKKEDQIIHRWAVNINPKESVMERIPLENIKKIFGEQTFELSLKSKYAAQIEQFRYGSEMTKWFFLLALLFMFLEMMLGREDLLRSIPWVRNLLKEGDKA